MAKTESPWGLAILQLVEETRDVHGKIEFGEWREEKSEKISR